MRVALYSPFIPVSHPNPSGARTQARAVVAALERQGHEVRVMSDFRTSSFWLRPRRLRTLPSALWSAYRNVRAFRPDAWLTVVSRRDVPDVFGPVFSWWLRIPYVIYKAPKRVTYRELRRKEGTIRHVWSALPGYLLDRLALAAADHVIAHKSRDYERHRTHGRTAKKLSLLLPAVSPQRFHPDADERKDVRHSLDIPEHRRVILSVSRLAVGRKASSVRFLIDRTAELRTQGHDVHLVIAGDGPAQTALEAHASHLASSVTFVGRVEHAMLRAYYNAADVFAFPGLGEHLGMVYLEALACGLPVVAFDNGGIPDVVTHGETGFLVEPMDGRAFLARLEQLVTDDGLRAAMGRAGVERTRSRHDLDAWGERLSGFLTDGTPVASRRYDLVQ